jgi:hypothetical protein
VALDETGQQALAESFMIASPSHVSSGWNGPSSENAPSVTQEVTVPLPPLGARRCDPHHARLGV